MVLFERTNDDSLQFTVYSQMTVYIWSNFLMTQHDDIHVKFNILFGPYKFQKTLENNNLIEKNK